MTEQPVSPDDPIYRLADLAVEGGAPITNGAIDEIVYADETFIDQKEPSGAQPTGTLVVLDRQMPSAMPHSGSRRRSGPSSSGHRRRA